MASRSSHQGSSHSLPLPLRSHRHSLQVGESGPEPHDAEPGNSVVGVADDEQHRATGGQHGFLEAKAIEPPEGCEGFGVDLRRRIEILGGTRRYEVIRCCQWVVELESQQCELDMGLEPSPRPRLLYRMRQRRGDH